MLVVAALFMTGLAQERIVPWARGRAAQAIHRATSAVKPGSDAPVTGAMTEPANAAGGAGFGAGSGGVAGRDSSGTSGAALQALSMQIETQRAFLAEREAELARMRAGIDSLRQTNQAVDEIERKRTAKLLSAMKPEEAARVLEQMDDPTLALLLDSMNAKAAAKVMARLDAGRVARLTSHALRKSDVTGVIRPEGQEAEAAPQ